MESKFCVAGMKAGDGHTCVIYNADTGRIQHMHTVWTIGEAKPPLHAEIEEIAFNLARERGRDLKNAKTLHLPTNELNPGAAYRVDVKRECLIEEPGGPPATPARGKVHRKTTKRTRRKGRSR